MGLCGGNRFCACSDYIRYFHDRVSDTGEKGAAESMKLKAVNRMLLYALFIAISLFAFFPFYWTLTLATQSANQIYSNVSFGFGDALADNWRILTSNSYFFISYLNSTIVAVTHTILAILISALTGYTLAKFVFWGNRTIFIFILSTMMIPGYVGLVAFVWQMSRMGLMNTLYPLILAGAALPFGVFWMKQYIESAVPSEMMEASRIDGCGEVKLFFQIILPIIFPATISLGLIIFIGKWNDFLLPVLVLQDPSKYTIPVTIRNLTNFYNKEYGAQLLGVMFGVIPLIILFLFTSRKLIDGITAGAVKG
jgi:multiple sugar transport system permease protein/cellobiose transport system permease protein